MGGIAGRVFRSLITSMTDATDKAAKTARAVGVTVGQLQELNFAAQLSGGSANDVTKILSQLAKAGREAQIGTKTFKDAFADLGVEVTDSQGRLKSTTDLLGDVSDRFQTMQDGSEKTALAMKLFGRTGARMVPFLSEGRSGLAKMAKEANRLGIVMSDQAAKRSERFTDAMLRAKSAVQGIRNRIAVAMLPTLNRLLEGFALWLSDGERVAKMLRVIKLAASVLGSVLATLAARQIAGLIAGFGGMIARAGAAVVALFRLSGAQARVAVTTKLLAGAFKVLAASGVLIIAAAVADLFKLATGKESVIAKALGEEGAADLGKTLKEIGGVFKTLLKELAPALAEILKAIAPLIPPLAKILGFLGKILAVLVKGIIKAVKFVIRLFARLGKVIGNVANFFRSVWDSTVGAVISKVREWISALGGVKRVVEVIAIPFKIIGVIVDGIKASLRTVIDFFKDAIDLAARLAGTEFGAKVKRLDVGGAPTASPTSPGGVARGLAPAGSGGTVNQTNQNTTTVNVQGAGDPQAVANRVAATVAASQKEAQNAQLRQAMANIRGTQ
jgi:phage-related protein